MEDKGHLACLPQHIPARPVPGGGFWLRGGVERRGQGGFSGRPGSCRKRRAPAMPKGILAAVLLTFIRKNFSKVIELKPDYINAYYFWGKAYEIIGDLEKAKEDFKKNIELKAKNLIS